MLFAGMFILSMSAFNNDADTDYQTSSTMLYEYTWTKDTISNANNDTLYLPSRLRPVNSDYIMAVSVTRTNISGTTNLAVKVEGTTYNYTGSTKPTSGWCPALNTANAAAATAATTATEETLMIPNAYYKNYRVVVDGTGTQSTSYTIRLVMKKKT